MNSDKLSCFFSAIIRFHTQNNIITDLAENPNIWTFLCNDATVQLGRRRPLLPYFYFPPLRRFHKGQVRLIILESENTTDKANLIEFTQEWNLNDWVCVIVKIGLSYICANVFLAYEYVLMTAIAWLSREEHFLGVNDYRWTGHKTIVWRVRISNWG